jgi:hypothetical protein
VPRVVGAFVAGRIMNSRELPIRLERLLAA